jgi:hypothetical protein
MSRNIWKFNDPYKVYIEFTSEIHNKFADFLEENDLELLPKSDLDSEDGLATFEIVPRDWA